MNPLHLMRPGQGRAYCGRRGDKDLSTTSKTAFLKTPPELRCSQCGLVREMHAQPRGKAVAP